MTDKCHNLQHLPRRRRGTGKRVFFTDKCVWLTVAMTMVIVLGSACQALFGPNSLDKVSALENAHPRAIALSFYFTHWDYDWGWRPRTWYDGPYTSIRHNEDLVREALFRLLPGSTISTAPFSETDYRIAAKANYLFNGAKDYPGNRVSGTERVLGKDLRKEYCDWLRDNGFQALITIGIGRARRQSPWDSLRIETSVYDLRSCYLGKPLHQVEKRYDYNYIDSELQREKFYGWSVQKTVIGAVAQSINEWPVVSSRKTALPVPPRLTVAEGPFGIDQFCIDGEQMLPSSQKALGLVEVTPRELEFFRQHYDELKLGVLRFLDCNSTSNYSVRNGRETGGCQWIWNKYKIPRVLRKVPLVKREDDDRIRYCALLPSLLKPSEWRSRKRHHRTTEAAVLVLEDEEIVALNHKDNLRVLFKDHKEGVRGYVDLADRRCRDGVSRLKTATDLRSAIEKFPEVLLICRDEIEAVMRRVRYREYCSGYAHLTDDDRMTAIGLGILVGAIVIVGVLPDLDLPDEFVSSHSSRVAFAEVKLAFPAGTICGRIRKVTVDGTPVSFEAGFSPTGCGRTRAVVPLKGTTVTICAEGEIGFLGPDTHAVYCGREFIHGGDTVVLGKQ